MLAVPQCILELGLVVSIFTPSCSVEFDCLDTKFALHRLIADRADNSRLRFVYWLIDFFCLLALQTLINISCLVSPLVDAEGIEPSF